jgi:hypothetical protein
MATTYVRSAVNSSNANLWYNVAFLRLDTALYFHHALSDRFRQFALVLIQSLSHELGRIVNKPQANGGL